MNAAKHSHSCPSRSVVKIFIGITSSATFNPIRFSGFVCLSCSLRSSAAWPVRAQVSAGRAQVIPQPAGKTSPCKYTSTILVLLSPVGRSSSSLETEQAAHCNLTGNRASLGDPGQVIQQPGVPLEGRLHHIRCRGEPASAESLQRRAARPVRAAWGTGSILLEPARLPTAPSLSACQSLGGQLIKAARDPLPSTRQPGHLLSSTE